MTPWLLKHSPGFSSILIYTGPAGVAKAHVHRLCSRSLLLGVFLEKLQPRVCEGEGKNRKGKSAWSYGYFSYPVTGVSGKDFQQRSCLCVSDFIHKADFFFFFFFSARVCVFVRTHVWALHRSLISLKSCLFSRFAPTTNISLIKAAEKACHFKQSTHTRTHARKHTHPSQCSPARCHGNLVNSTPTVTQLLHQASQSGVGGERRKRASGAQLQFQLVSFHMCRGYEGGHAAALSCTRVSRVSLKKFTSTIRFHRSSSFTLSAVTQQSNFSRHSVRHLISRDKQRCYLRHLMSALSGSCINSRWYAAFKSFQVNLQRD